MRLRLAGVLLDLLADPANVHVDRPCVADVVDAPQPLQYLVAGEDPAAMRHEQREQLERPGLELDRLAAALQGVARQVQLQVAGDDALRPRLAGACAGPSQHRPHSRQQLPHAEGLDHVVVRAQLKADDAVHLLVPGGEEQYRNVAVAPDQAADLESVQYRQHDVENQQVRVFLGGLPQPLFAIGSRQRTVTLALQVVPDGREEVFLVLHDQHGLPGLRCQSSRSLELRLHSFIEDYTQAMTGMVACLSLWLGALQLRNGVPAPREPRGVGILAIAQREVDSRPGPVGLMDG